MHPDDLFALLVVVGEVVRASFPVRLFPSHHRSQDVADVGPVSGAGVVPAVVAARVLVDGEVIAAAGGANELAFLVAGLELLEEVEDVKGHAAWEESDHHAIAGLVLQGLWAIRKANGSKGLQEGFVGLCSGSPRQNHAHQPL